MCRNLVMRRNLVLISMFIILAGINWSIVGKENHLATGHIVYLDLAPVDPRSLMQGDYMALRFRIGVQVYQALPKSEEYKRWRHNAEGEDGYAIVEQDNKGIAQFKRLYREGESLAKNELRLRYRVRQGAVKFATNAFFFEEGQGEVYELARYGQFRVNNTGELLLAGMFDKDLRKLESTVPRAPKI
jgi:uncharacterized membrane-anchored protein